MQLEPGDCFAIERGRCLTPEMETSLGKMPAQHDHSFDGCIFKLIVQEHTLMAVEVIFPHTGAGQTFSLDCAGMELMPVSRQYIQALQNGAQFKAPPEGRLNPSGGLDPCGGVLDDGHPFLVI